jgi:hypothetical protein
MLVKYKDIFIRPGQPLSTTDRAEYTINTGEQRPIRQKARSVRPVAEEAAIEKEVAQMKEKGVIVESHSPWSSPVVLVKKKNGEVRFCVDFRVLNEHTVKDPYPLPRTDRTLEALSGSLWFCTMDLTSGFWQITLNAEDREKTAFATTSSLYEFMVMPFGLCNAPATFERCVENVLRGLCWKDCLVY